MRESDVFECKAMVSLSPYDALKLSVAGSNGNAVTILHGNEPVAIFGVGFNLEQPEMGSPWLLATDKFETIPRFILKYSRRVLAEMRKDFQFLFNYTHADNERSIRWLKWCGFEFDEKPIQVGVDNEKFYRFWIEGENCQF
jgi:hypothetical protein